MVSRVECVTRLEVGLAAVGGVVEEPEVREVGVTPLGDQLEACTPHALVEVQARVGVLRDEAAVGREVDAPAVGGATPENRERRAGGARDVARARVLPDLEVAVVEEVLAVLGDAVDVAGGNLGPDAGCPPVDRRGAAVERREVGIAVARDVLRRNFVVAGARELGRAAEQARDTVDVRVDVRAAPVVEDALVLLDLRAEARPPRPL